VRPDAARRVWPTASRPRWNWPTGLPSSNSPTKPLDEKPKSTMHPLKGAGQVLQKRNHERIVFSARFACPVSGFTIDEIEPRLFSFNAPREPARRATGSAPSCSSSPNWWCPTEPLSLSQGAIAPWAKTGASSPYYEQTLVALAGTTACDRRRGSDLPKRRSTGHPVRFGRASSHHRLRRRPAQIQDAQAVRGRASQHRAALARNRFQWVREELSRYQLAHPCEDCDGYRRRSTSGWVPQRRRPRIPDDVALGGHARRRRGAAHPARLADRLRPDRRAVRARRAVDRAAPARQRRLLDTLATAARPRQHRDRRRARRGDDPRPPTTSSTSGRAPASTAARSSRRASPRHHGGARTASPGSTCRAQDDPGAGQRREPTGLESLTVVGAREQPAEHRRRHPARQLHLRHRRLGRGKSTLVIDILYRADARGSTSRRCRPGEARPHRRHRVLDKVIDIDQSPIGRTPRSNPATYTGAFDNVRELVRQTPRPRRAATSRAVLVQRQGRALRGLPGRRHVIKIEMHFLPDVYVPCEVCKGARYNRDTLDIEFKGKNIADVLDMTVEEARSSSPTSRDPRQAADAARRRARLRQGRPAGDDAVGRRGAAGEARPRSWPSAPPAARSTSSTSRRPACTSTTSRKLLTVLHALVDQGNTVLVIEHNLDVIKTADWIIDLGPEGGDGGGQLKLAVTTGENHPLPLTDHKTSYRAARACLLA
jgi:hypothetical protein